jgi:hypothetical protein
MGDPHEPAEGEGHVEECVKVLVHLWHLSEQSRKERPLSGCHSAGVGRTHLSLSWTSTTQPLETGRGEGKRDGAAGDSSCWDGG